MRRAAWVAKGRRGKLRGMVVSLVFLILLAGVAGLAPAARAEAASLSLRVGLVWERWAVEVTGRPGGGLSLSGGPHWPGQRAGLVNLADGGRFSVAASSPRVAAAAAESSWLARAVEAGICRTGGPGEAAGTTGPDCTTARMGALWYVLFHNGAGTDPAQASRDLQGRSLPAFTLLWPSVPALGGNPVSPCAIRLDGVSGGLSFRAPAPLSFSPGADWARVEHVRKPYRGRLEILPAGGNKLFSLVNVLDIEDYLLGVVPSEMPAAWPLEALKAQAVAARTYAVSNLGRHGSRGFDLCDDIHCQAYLGYSNEYPGPTSAVRATAGIVATYGGRLINAVYHAHAGGATDSSAVIWGASEPYLVGTGRTYEQPYYWTATNRRTEVEAAVASSVEGAVAEGLFPLLTASPGDFTPGGRARTVRLAGPAATGSVSAGSLRSKLGTYRLRSAAFTARLVQSAWLWPDWLSLAGMSAQPQAMTWVPGDRGGSVLVFSAQAPSGNAIAPLGLLSPEFFVFSGQGFGHGVGMSQWGAREMAAAGKSYGEILGQFYQGIKLSSNYGR